MHKNKLKLCSQNSCKNSCKKLQTQHPLPPNKSCSICPWRTGSDVSVKLSHFLEDLYGLTDHFFLRFLPTCLVDLYACRVCVNSGVSCSCVWTGTGWNLYYRSAAGQAAVSWSWSGISANCERCWKRVYASSAGNWVRLGDTYLLFRLILLDLSHLSQW